MDSGDNILGQESTSRCGESDSVPSKWCQENPAIVTMSTYDSQEGKPQVNPEHLTNPASVQYFSSLKVGSQNEATQQLSENQFTQKRPGSYTHRHSLSFPQHNLHQPRLMHSTKPHQSLEGHAYPYSHLPVSPEDLFFRMHGHSTAFSRKKISALASYSQYSQKSIEQSEDTHKKEQKPKKPGKYICPYCTRACAKPSVLKKHIRSHTGERPYPCVPCGFSFKTKSNLYKHRKSHAHAIKAGLVPFTDSSVSKLDLDSSCIDVEAEIHSDGEQSTDTDEETLLLVEETEKLPLDVAVKSGEFLDPGFHTSEESLGGSVKVPILIFPKSGINLSETPHYITPELMHNPSFIGKNDEPHTARQKLALKLTEKKGQDSEKSSNLLSPHSKGSTDSGYFSRSESAEQNISPPNTNATSYEEIIFGKYCRLSPRSSLQSQEVSLPVVNTSIIEEHMPDFLSKNEVLLDHSKIKTIKSRLTGTRISELQKSHLITEPNESESKLYSDINQGQTVLLEAPSDVSPLIRSNSMPTSGASLSIPPSIRGSHSFDERMTGSDDVFYPGTTGIPQQRLLRRQGAFELPLVLEGHSDFDAYNRISKNAPAYSRKTVHEKTVSLKEKKIASMYDYSASGIHPKRWDDYEAYKHGYRDVQYIGGMKPGGDYFNDSTAPLISRVGTMIENRKRRKEKSVGDEEDISVPSGSSVGSPVIDVETKPQSQGNQVSFSISGQDYIYSGSQDIGRSHQQIGGPVSVLDESSSDTDKVVDLARKPPGNVISVIQHTNSLSRPNSFERSESTELFSSSQSVCSPEACDNTMSSMSPDSTQVLDVSESPGRPSLSQHPQQTSYHIPPKLVRQHNITVPEIRVTEEPDKPEKEPEIPIKEPEKPPEEFQWPQRSETLSQLPAEKLPPKKKRLRLADMENSSGESSFESTGTSLSRSPSQESNLSHSSSFSMSFDRDDIIKSTLPIKQDDIGRPPELLTVPPGAYSLSVPGHHHQKEMRRSSSEQIPCPSLTEIPEIRSKSFDYGNLTHASGLGAITTTLSPARERKKCFLVRQASFSGFPETSQADQEQTGSQEQSDQVHGSRRSSQVAWQLSPSSSTNSDEAGNVAVGTSPQPTCTSSLYSQQCISSYDTLRSSLAPQSSCVSKRHFPEQQHVLSHPEKVLYPPIHSTFHLPYPSVCMSQIQASPPLLWPSCMDPLQRQFQHHLHNLQKTYFKPPLQSELQTSSYFDTAQEHTGCKPHNYLHSIEKSYQPYLEPSLFTSSTKKSKHILSKLQRDHSGGSSDSSTDQQLSVSLSPGPLLPLSGPVVPVRIQTHVPSYGSVMYTSISQIIVTHSQTNSSSIVICKVDGSTSQKIMETNPSMRGLGFNIAQMLAPCRELEQYPVWKVPQTLPLGIESTIPLCLVPASDNTSTFGGGKRMLSPASSLELFMETKQQKRVKEERMYGQIVKELSAVELTNSDIKKDFSRTSKPQLVRQGHTTEKKDFLSDAQTPPPSLPDSPLNISSSIEKGSPESKSSDATEGRMSPDEFYNEDSASDMSLSPQRTPSETLEEEPLKNKNVAVGILMETSERPGTKNVASSILIKDGSEVHQILQFPSLRTTTTVSWCFLNYAKPSHTEQESLKSSVYASWCISSCNPNPSGLSTRTSLALLRSKQKHTLSVYTMAAMHRSGAGKLTSSRIWKLQFAQMKPEPSLLVSSKLEKKASGSTKDRIKGESHGEKDISAKQTEPMRIKIFEGGFKSNEDYVYVRGRGRGKYICEECGIRCKKPSMLKKHIRTHTDVRPYVCKLCNFAFKTKGNLTKHMKSKAHMKKCLELGVAMTSVDDAETEESGNIEEMQKTETEKSGISIDHQFSDAEETDGDDGDDNDNEDEDDEEDEFDDNQGDVTPKSRSRSTSPQPPRFSTLSVTASSASHRSSPEGTIAHSPLMSYLSTMPSIQVTHLLTPSTIGEDSQMIDYQRLYLTSRDHDRDKMDVPGSMDDDYMLTSEPSSSPRDFSSCSHHSSPGYDSSPCRDNSPKRYLSLRGDLSPRRHLSPRRDASPMKHLSPRKEAALRRELSPRRDVSPRRHLSPLRPMSPAKDISAGRDLSPRRERRYMATFRALSPRRRLHHNPSLPMSHYIHSEPGLLGHGSLRKMRPQFPYIGPHAEDIPGHQSLGQDPDGHKDYVFSHLPLHSQQQIRAPLPMIPVGGIQIINSNSAIQASPHPSITTPLHLRSSDEKTIFSESCIPLHLDKHSSPDIPAGDPLPASSPTLLPSPGQSPSEESSMPTEREQEENIHTCTKAIAFLRIAAEEGQPLKRDQLSHPPEPNQKTLESAQFGIRHFSGLEVSMPLACSSATPVDLHREKDSFSTSQSTQAHSKFYSKTMDMTKLGFHSRKEEPTSTQKVKDSSSESSSLE